MNRQTPADTVIEPNPIVAAGAVVIRDVSPGIVVGNVPARIISPAAGNAEA